MYVSFFVFNENRLVRVNKSDLFSKKKLIVKILILAKLKIWFSDYRMFLNFKYKCTIFLLFL